MEAVPAQFERVLNIKRRKDWIDGPSTTFQFIPVGRQLREVCVRGTPSLKDGMIVLAVLRDKDDWGSLVGWKDLETGAIVGKSLPTARKAVALLSAFVGALLVALFMGVSFGTLIGAFTIFSFAIWSAVRELHEAKEAQRLITNFERRDEA